MPLRPFYCTLSWSDGGVAPQSSHATPPSSDHHILFQFVLIKTFVTAMCKFDVCIIQLAPDTTRPNLASVDFLAQAFHCLRSILCADYNHISQCTHKPPRSIISLFGWRRGLYNARTRPPGAWEYDQQITGGYDQQITHRRDKRFIRIWVQVFSPPAPL